ncbi:hypothetical protein L9W92_01545 [Pelotomaculum terephthalicicum JT]|uniref:hypothetical protein n=1 Tax=Pelotomaculum terephthalicicum TaxID=206393 RepID=UPI001F03CB0B|nr:hypothetical protein [Pelotomaculum terephthalicicum]MCG9966741.1 hypothetical protein [Pelotomaculum terephthalicicum JT]
MDPFSSNTGETHLRLQQSVQMYRITLSTHSSLALFRTALLFASALLSKLCLAFRLFLPGASKILQQLPLIALNMLRSFHPHYSWR